METKKQTIDLAAIQQKRWLSPEEASACGYFRSARAASMRRYRGQQPAFFQEYVGGSVLYDRKILDAWLESLRWDPAENPVE